MKVKTDTGLIIYWREIAKYEYLSIMNNGYYKSRYYVQMITNKAGTKYYKTLTSNYCR